MLADGETGNGIVPAIGREQELPIWRKDDATRALESIRCVFLAANRLVGTGAGATCGHAFHLVQRSVHGAMVMDDEILALSENL